MIRFYINDVILIEYIGKNIFFRNIYLFINYIK